jgi:tRNA modification GTPase
MAIGHLLGRASTVYETWRSDMISIAAHLEAAIDFSEEEGVAEIALRDVKFRTRELIETLSSAVTQSDRAGTLRSGVKVVIAGAPNVGKSSLLNLVAARQAAIVSPIPGTTRDVVEVSIVLRGMPVILSDTAGLRPEGNDEIENIGMQRARTEIANADIFVWMSSPDVALEVELPAIPDISILNKLDLLADNSIHVRNDQTLGLSTLTGEGLGEFLVALEGLIEQRFGAMEQAVVVRARQRDAVEESIRCLNDSLIHDVDHIELAAECLRRACHSMARITGRVDVEDLLDKIFNEFCIGK